jgi:peptidoglycan-associated lipoprotein
MMNIQLQTLVIAMVFSLMAGCASRPPAGAAQGTQTGAGQTLPGYTVSPYAQAGQYDTASASRPGGPGTAGSSARTVYFDFDSSEIRPDGRPVLEENARYLTANPSVAVTLEGHTDERGTREYNIGLGDRRAEAVLRALNAYGVSAEQMRTLSYGEERPAATGHTEESYAKNRRVEIVY